MFFHYIDCLENFIWNGAGLLLLGFSGVYFSIRCGFFQIFRSRLWFSKTAGTLFSRKRGEKGAGISPLRAACTALAATIGVGNIAGVASAITIGGPGAVFWMLIAALLGMATSLFENTLGHFYRRKNARGEWIGGAMFYLRDGIGGKSGRILAFFFALFCAAAAFGIGNIGQIKVISDNIRATIYLPTLERTQIFGSDLYSILLGLLLFIAAGAVILGGRERITGLTEKIVPAMVFFFTLLSLAVIILNAHNLYPAIRSILNHAFSPRAAGGGAAGAIISRSLGEGFKRGVFSNEAGMGSATVINAAADTEEPAEQGMWGIFEVFIDTVLMCSLTALCILCSGVVNLESGDCLVSADGATLVNLAFRQTFGKAGAVFIAAAVLLFAFSTVIGWSFFGSSAAEYLFGEGGGSTYRACFIGIIPFGAIIPFDFALKICDILNGLMLFPNLIGVLFLSPLAVEIIKNYLARQRGERLQPMLSFEQNIFD